MGWVVGVGVDWVVVIGLVVVVGCIVTVGLDVDVAVGWAVEVAVGVVVASGFVVNQFWLYPIDAVETTIITISTNAPIVIVFILIHSITFF